MNGVVVLNVLSRMAVGISNIAHSLSNSLGCTALAAQPSLGCAAKPWLCYSFSFVAVD